ncbi:hypothetical protein LCGC14_2766780 [marine sediment metagenome]|uniref:Uncharacterized protein n=1 Tax=marine sediment metagenome TaxID=412755 RepID=A0A0F8ZJ66_9ZZZZ
MSEQTGKRRRSMWAPIVAILVIGALEALALMKGINGTTLRIAIVAIAGAGGFTLKGILK